MYHVLLAVGASEERARAAAEAVHDLPGREDVRVTVLHVFEDNPSGATVTQHATVRAATPVLDERDIDHTVRGDSGDTATVIQDVAADVDADCIALGGRKRTLAGKAVFGSVTQAVLHNADRPVLVAGNGV